MPIYDIICIECGYSGEVLQIDRHAALVCPACGSDQTEKQMSATSSLTGRDGQALPGPGDTACCGSQPGQASGCAGPGSCCGRN